MSYEISARSLSAFVRSIAVLSFDANDQRRWLNSLMPGGAALADEIALEFDEGHLLLGHYIERDWISPEVRPILDKIDRMLEEMSTPEMSAVWDVASLETSPHWAELRELAKAALFQIR